MADLQRSEPSLQWMGRGPKPLRWRAFCASARLMLGRNLLSARNSIATVIAVALVLVLGVVVGTMWTSIGDSEISPAGWIAMGFGVVITLAVGIGLMALVFISSRRGYDERAGGSKAAGEQNSSQ
jgi:TRAP-type C4-dicarboxylate transport system permease small subunit